MTGQVVITGIGMVVPSGRNPNEVFLRVERGERAGSVPSGFDSTRFACRLSAEVRDFQPEQYVAETKMLRLMSRDSQLAAAAAQLALKDARLSIGHDYPGEDVALYGATGLVGMPWSEMSGLINRFLASDGCFDPRWFGREGLRSINPLSSFKILSNMPVCFVSMFEHIKGSNAIYTPWEGQGAQAISAGARAIQNGSAQCAVVGGCDVKTHELAFISLQRLGLFDSWEKDKTGMVPGEGSVFLVLENTHRAQTRGARIYARLTRSGFCTRYRSQNRSVTHAKVLQKALQNMPAANPFVVAASDDDSEMHGDEFGAWETAKISVAEAIFPKISNGNLFAAAAALQVAIGALWVEKTGRRILANCFGHGSEQAAFVLEQP